MVAVLLVYPILGMHVHQWLHYLVVCYHHHDVYVCYYHETTLMLLQWQLACLSNITWFMISMYICNTRS